MGYDDGLVMLTRLTDGSEILVRHPAQDRDSVRISALAWDAKGARLAFGAENGDAGVLTLPKG